MTRTAQELSIVCLNECVPVDVHAERDRRLLQVEGTLAFSLTGILAAVTAPLAAAGISIFAMSTYDTDYLLLLEKDLPQAIQTLESAGHSIRTAETTS